MAPTAKHTMFSRTSSTTLQKRYDFDTEDDFHTRKRTIIIACVCVFVFFQLILLFFLFLRWQKGRNLREEQRIRAAQMPHYNPHAPASNFNTLSNNVSYGGIQAQRQKRNDESVLEQIALNDNVGSRDLGPRYDMGMNDGVGGVQRAAGVKGNGEVPSVPPPPYQGGDVRRPESVVVKDGGRGF